MRKRNLLISLILITSVLSSTAAAFGYTQVGQRLRTSAQPAVAIEKTSSNESGTINAETGTHGGLSASFNLTTNGDDSGYDYMITSTASVSEGSTSAFTKINGQTAIAFINVDHEPNLNEIRHAKLADGLNGNVIVYPISMQINSPMEVNYVPSHILYDNCWQVKVNGATEGTLVQTISGTPIANTFDVTADSAGSYRATVLFTAIAK